MHGPRLEVEMWKKCRLLWHESHFEVKMYIKGLDNPTSHFLTISRNKSCSRTGKEGKTKEVVEDSKFKKVV